MHLYTVFENKQITRSTQLLTLVSGEHERPLSFQPGQYAAISFLRRGRFTPDRCFSIVSSPTDQHYLQFSMRVKGRFTRALTELKNGDEVRVLGPFGGFEYNAATDRNTVMMAGGIGITPIMSMIRYAARLHSDNHITLLYSSQSQDDIPFKEELMHIDHHHPNIKVIFVIGDGKADKLPAKNAATGFITPELVDKAINKSYADHKFFICGPPPFMKAMTGLALKKGVSKDRLVTEAFSQATPRHQGGVLRSWPINAYVMGALGVVLGSVIVMIMDLIRTLPPLSSTSAGSVTSSGSASSRQEQLNKLINSIPPSPNAIPSPSSNTPAASSKGSGSTTTQTVVQPPVYTAAPQPTTTASTPPP